MANAVPITYYAPGVLGLEAPWDCTDYGCNFRTHPSERLGTQAGPRRSADRRGRGIEAQQALDEGIPFVSHVVGKKLAQASQVAQAAAEEFGSPLLDIEAIDIDAEITKLVDEKLIRQHHTLPLYKRGSRLFVGVADPTNLQALDEIKFHVGSTVEAIVCEADKLQRRDRALCWKPPTTR